MNTKGNFIATTAIALLIILGSPASAELSAEQVLEKYYNSMKSLNDLEASAKLDLNLLLGILPYSEKLSGRYYYLKPNNHKLEFDDAPSYFDKAPSMFNWNLPSLEKYSVVAAPSPKATSKRYNLLFKPKRSGSSTQSVTCTFDAADWTLLEQKTSYRDGGSVSLFFSYLADRKLPVLDTVVAKVSIPAYSLTGGATISFSSQKTNEGLEDHIFEENSQ